MRTCLVSFERVLPLPLPKVDLLTLIAQPVGKRGLPRELERMHAFLTKGLTQTASLWADVEQGYAWVHQAAHLLSNDQKQTTAEVRQAYETLLAQMEQAPTPSEPLAVMLSTFRKVTTSYWPGLFHCYDLSALPRTNNDLEQYFGSARYHER